MLFSLIGSLIRFATSLALLPFKMLSRNFIGTIILFGLVYILWPKGDGTQPTPTTATPARTTNGQPAPRIDAINDYQDGNSRFSDDLLSQMTAPELRHYSSVFFWVMGYQDAGQPYGWSFYNIHGSITPYARFKNSFGHECRKFTEVLKVHTIQQKFSGLACENPNGGWCRLRHDSTPLCGIGEKKQLFQGFGDKMKSLF